MLGFGVPGGSVLAGHSSSTDDRTLAIAYASLAAEAQSVGFSVLLSIEPAEIAVAGQDVALRHADVLAIEPTEVALVGAALMLQVEALIDAAEIAAECADIAAHQMALLEAAGVAIAASDVLFLSELLTDHAEIAVYPIGISKAERRVIRVIDETLYGARSRTSVTGKRDVASVYASPKTSTGLY